MPILPYRVERLALEPDGAPLVVYRIHDASVAVRLSGGLFVAYENPFTADDPRHELTGELLDLLTHEEPGWTGGRAPWRPDIVERIRAQHAAAAPALHRGHEAIAREASPGPRRRP